MPGTWYPGDNAAGSQVFGAPAIFSQPVTFQKGSLTNAPVPTSPGTVATGGTVSNALGYDAVVYASATTGIQSVKIGATSIPGSVNSGQTADYIVPGASTITITYTGVLSWVWLAT